MFCLKCNINWARLWSQDRDDISGETVEYCPHCQSALDLVAQRPGPKFTKCPFTGVIRNVATGRELWIVGYTILKTGKIRRKVFTESLEEFRERQEKAQEEWMDRYNKLLDTMSPEDAAREVKVEVVERKWAWNDEV